MVALRKEVSHRRTTRRGGGGGGSGAQGVLVEWGEEWCDRKQIWETWGAAGRHMLSLWEWEYANEERLWKNFQACRKDKWLLKNTHPNDYKAK